MTVGRSYTVWAKERDLAPQAARQMAIGRDGLTLTRTLYVSERMADGTYEVVLAEPDRPVRIVPGRGETIPDEGRITRMRDLWAARRRAFEAGE